MYIYTFALCLCSHLLPDGVVAEEASNLPLAQLIVVGLKLIQLDIQIPDPQFIFQITVIEIPASSIMQ